MRHYIFKLSNNESWYLTADMTLKEVKQHISSSDFIKLSQIDFYLSSCISREADIQTNNIVYVVEDEKYQERLDEREASKKRVEEIDKEIRQYKFNLRMKCWLIYNFVSFNYGEENSKDFSEEFSNEVLNRCKKYNCPKR